MYELFSSKTELLRRMEASKKYYGYRKSIKKIISLLTHEYVILGGHAPYVFFCNNIRKDFNNIVSSSMDACHYNKTRIEIRKRWRLGFDIVKFQEGIKELKRLYSKLDYLLGNQYGIKSKVCLLVDMLDRSAVYDAFVKYDFSETKVFFTVRDMQYYEHIGNICANNYGVCTITSSHGVDANRKELFKDRPREFVAKMVTVWGWDDAYTFSANYRDKLFLICGNAGIKEQETDNKKIIGIVMDIAAFGGEFTNQKMISIVESFAKKTGYMIKIRLHPGDTIDNYEINDSITSVNDNLLDADFLVAYKTSMIFTYMRLGKRVFVLKDESNINDYENGILFSDAYELEVAYKDFYDYDFIGFAKKYLTYIDDCAKEQYSKVFDLIEHNVDMNRFVTDTNIVDMGMVRID